jgi:hypothetical protein
MASIIGSVGKASASVSVGMAKAVGESRVAGAKAAAIQAKTAAQIERQQARAMKSGVTGGLIQFSLYAAAARTVANTVGGVITAFRESQQAGKKLDSVLASTGGAAGVTAEEIKALAGDMQRLTNFEDDATIAAAGVLATFTQIKGDTFKDALMAAQDLSAVMGQDIQASVVQIGKALNDPIAGITALRRVGVSFTKEQQQQIKNLVEQGRLQDAQRMILAELQTEFGGAAQAMADPLTIVGNVIGDLGESLGSLIMPALTEIAQFIVSNLVPHSETLAQTFTSWGEILRGWVAESLLFVTQVSSYLRAGFTIIYLGVVQLAGAMEHFFTQELPVYFNWFLQNWGNLWSDALNMVQTVFSNLGSNIAENMTAIWDYIASGGTIPLEMAWTPLLDGFKSTVDEIPKIAARIPSELEKSLGEELTALEQQIAQGITGKLDEVAPKARQMEQGKKALEPAVGPVRAVGAMEAGSTAALQTIFGAMRSKEDEALALQRQQAEIAQQQLDELKAMTQDEELVEIEAI